MTGLENSQTQLVSLLEKTSNDFTVSQFDLQEARAEIDGLSARVVSLEATKAELEGQVAVLTEELATATMRVSVLEDTQKSLEGKIEVIENEKAVLAQEIIDFDAPTMKATLDTAQTSLAAADIEIAELKAADKSAEFAALKEEHASTLKKLKNVEFELQECQGDMERLNEQTRGWRPK